MTTPQERVAAWVRSTLGDDDARNVPERALRAAEEVIELAQACGLGQSSLHMLVEYVFSRPVGDPKKEIAGCTVTLYAIAEALGANLESEFEIEIARIHRPEVVERVRRRQTEKREVVSSDIPHPDPYVTQAGDVPIDCPCTDWTIVGFPRTAYHISWFDGSPAVKEHHPACSNHPANKTQESTDLRKQRDALWALLDNIDTLDDSCRGNNAAFRDLSRKHLRARFEVHNPEAVTFSEPVRLPDGSGFFTGTFPLPKTHWIYADHVNEPPMPMRTGTADLKRKELERQITAAARHAVRASTRNGKEMDFDPDAMVQNMIVGLIGYFTEDGKSRL